MRDRLYSTPQVAALTGVPRRTLEQRILGGELHPAFISRNKHRTHYFFTKRQIEEIKNWAPNMRLHHIGRPPKQKR